MWIYLMAIIVLPMAFAMVSHALSVCVSVEDGAEEPVESGVREEMAA